MYAHHGTSDILALLPGGSMLDAHQHWSPQIMYNDPLEGHSSKPVEQHHIMPIMPPHSAQPSVIQPPLDTVSVNQSQYEIAGPPMTACLPHHFSQDSYSVHHEPKGIFRESPYQARLDERIPLFDSVYQTVQFRE